MLHGYTQVYTGNGKGKTTAMLGLALRAIGAGLRVYIGQFMKNAQYNEVAAIKNHLPMVTFEQYGGNYDLGGMAYDSDFAAAEAGLKKAREAMLSGKYNVIALDEINMAATVGLLPIEAVLDLIKNKPHNVELVLTGRYAPMEVVVAADLVTEMHDVKHYYNRGVPARDGIEL